MIKDNEHSKVLKTTQNRVIILYVQTTLILCRSILTVQVLLSITPSLIISFVLSSSSIGLNTYSLVLLRLVLVVFETKLSVKP